MRIWTLFATFLINLVLFLTACSSEDKNAGGTSEAENSIAITDKTVAGVSQKGPFTKGSTVTLYELNFETRAQTGKSFFGKISDDKGNFSVNKIELASQYALLRADGFYRNEITGKLSSNQITLNAISDLSERDKVNINLLTHLEYERAVWLANENEMTIKDAKVEADKEIFAAFGVKYDGNHFEDLDIFGNGDADAALLAISVIMHAGRSESEFSLALADLAMDLEKDGKWDDAKAIAEAADNAFEADTTQIRMNMEGWNIAESIPDFAPIVEHFWNEVYGLERCTAKREGEIKPDNNSHSRYYQKDFVCIKSHWYLFDPETQFHTDQAIYDKCGGIVYDPSTQVCTKAVVRGICGENSYDLENEKCVEGVVKGVCGKELYDEETQFCSSKKIVYDKCGGRAYAPAGEFCFDKKIHRRCGDSGYNLTTEFCGADKKVYSKCDGNTYNVDSEFCYKGEILPLFCNDELYDSTTQFCYNETIHERCGGEMFDPTTKYCADDNTLAEIIDASEYDALNNTLKDLRDGQVYRTTVIAPEGTDYSEVWMAQNLNYKTSDSRCYGNEAANCETYGRQYFWEKTDMDGVGPKGWHLPSMNEWEALIVAVDGSITQYTSPNTAGTKLKSTSGWNDGDNGTDDYKFSAVYHGSAFWGSTPYTLVSLFGSSANLYLYDDSYDIEDDTYSIRCIQNTTP